MGFFKTSYWIIGVTLISIYLVYVFMVYQEEKGKVSTIGSSKTDQDWSEYEKDINAENFASIAIEDEYADNDAKTNNRTLNYDTNDEYLQDEDDNRRRTSVIKPIKLLPQDEQKKVGSMGLVFLRAKKLVHTEWNESGVFNHILFVIESPIKFLV